MDFVSHPEVGAVYITPAQAAQILGVNQGEIKRLVWEKHLDHQRVGGKTML